MSKINQLNVLRESNDTLRAESDRNMKKARSLTEELRVLQQQLQPLHEDQARLQSELVTKDMQIRLLEEDNARWKSRNEQVLAKYERIDPAELQALKDEVESLRKQAEDAAQSSAGDRKSLQSELDATKAALATAQETVGEVVLLLSNFR